MDGNSRLLKAVSSQITISFLTMDKNEPLMMGGEHYYLLNCRCPVCVERGLLTPEEIWLHAECGGYIYVGDKAHLLCDKCKNEIPITHAEFRCPYHSTSEDAYVVFHEHPFLHN